MYPSSIHNEVKQSSILVMQYLNINGHIVLCLYDRGANQHLIEGQLAKELNLKLLTKKPSKLSILSGGSVLPTYGSYKMLLGPTDSGKYHELATQGIKTITSKFPRYDLSDINSETLSTTDLPSDTPLPPYVGGESIGILFGIKTPDLEPTLVYTLPSGIGLYKSPFKDIFGSHYCYGGPHKVFSEANQRVHGNVNHLNIYLSEVKSITTASVNPSPYHVLESTKVNANLDLPDAEMKLGNNQGYKTSLAASFFLCLKAGKGFFLSEACLKYLGSFKILYDFLKSKLYTPRIL